MWKHTVPDPPDCTESAIMRPMISWEKTGGTMQSYPSGECGWCSNGPIKVYHCGPCPRVESIEYYPNGTVKSVKFRDA